MVATHLACCTRIVRTIQLLRQVQCSAGKAAAGQHGSQVASSAAKQEVQVAGTSQVVIQTLKRAEEEEKSCAHVSAHSLLPQTGYSYGWACASTGSMHRLPQVRQHRKAAAGKCSLGVGLPTVPQSSEDTGDCIQLRPAQHAQRDQSCLVDRLPPCRCEQWCGSPG